MVEGVCGWLGLVLLVSLLFLLLLFQLLSCQERQTNNKHTSQYVCTQEFCSEVLIATNHFSRNQITRCSVCPDQIAIHTRTMYLAMYVPLKSLTLCLSSSSVFVMALSRKSCVRSR